MDFYQLECILAVEKYRNFTRAAEAISISQSSLSQKIAKLEDELGVRLFERTTRAVYPSPAGLDFLKHANNIMEESTVAKRTVQDYRSADSGSIVIGAITIIGTYKIPSLIAAFQRDYQKVQIGFKDAECMELIPMLQEGKIDVAFINNISKNKLLKFHELIYDELAVVTSAHHPFAERGSIHLQEAYNEKFIMASPHSAVYFDSVEACQKSGFEPKVLYRCDSFDTILGFVKEDLGVSLLSYKAAHRYIDGELAIVRIQPSIPRIISLTVLKEAHLSPTVKSFINYAINWINV
jgi:LysR family hydrogen peroxide-inducible transcriptional activator